MKNLMRLFLALLIAALPLSALAKQDCVIIRDVSFKKLQQQAIFRSGGQWTRIEIDLQATENPDENASNKQWVRDIEVELTVVYKDEKASDKTDPSSMIVMKSKSQLFAIQVGKKVPVVFYIPWEAYSVYRIQADPFAWSIQLTVAGTPIALSKQNISTMVSKSIITSQNAAKSWENYKALVGKASKANDGILMPLNKCPFNVQWYEYDKGGNLPMPTYIEGR